MVDLHSILADHRTRSTVSSDAVTATQEYVVPTTSEIPDVFFDHILKDYKLTRIETVVLMYLYRKVWCRPNLYKIYGISQLMSHTEMAKQLCVGIEDIYHSLRQLEDYGFINTVRSGQYFVRKYFLKDNDELYGQTYDEFEV